MTIVAIDEGGTVDTSKCYETRAKQTVETHFLQEILLKNLCEAMDKKDFKALCQVSTQSAIINQDVLPKKKLSDLLKIIDKFDLPGLMVSHTGTYIGLLLNRDDKNYYYDYKKIAEELNKLDIKFEVFKSWWRK